MIIITFENKFSKFKSLTVKVHKRRWLQVIEDYDVTMNPRKYQPHRSFTNNNFWNKTPRIYHFEYLIILIL